MDEESAVAIRQGAGLAGYAGTDGQHRMIALADEFKAMCQNREKQKRPWLVKIGPGYHLKIEAWQYLGQRAGIISRTADYRELRNPATGEFEGFAASAEVFHIVSGQTIGRAEQVCYADEVVKKKDGTIYRRWLDEEGKPNRHAILGMAQTRAQSRALASVLRFLAELAGAEGTPAEEMDGVPQGDEKPPVKPPRRKPKPKPVPAPAAADDEAVVGHIDEVSTKSGTNDNGDWTRWGVRIDVEWYGTFDPEVGDVALAAKESGAKVRLAWEQKGKHKNITTLAIVPDDFDL